MTTIVPLSQQVQASLGQYEAQLNNEAAFLDQNFPPTLSTRTYSLFSCRKTLPYETLQEQFETFASERIAETFRTNANRLIMEMDYDADKVAAERRLGSLIKKDSQIAARAAVCNYEAFLNEELGFLQKHFTPPSCGKRAVSWLTCGYCNGKPVPYETLKQAFDTFARGRRITAVNARLQIANMPAGKERAAQFKKLKKLGKTVGQQIEALRKVGDQQFLKVLKAHKTIDQLEELLNKEHAFLRKNFLSPDYTGMFFNTFNFCCKKYLRLEVMRNNFESYLDRRMKLEQTISDILKKIPDEKSKKSIQTRLDQLKSLKEQVEKIRIKEAVNRFLDIAQEVTDRSSDREIEELESIREEGRVRSFNHQISELIDTIGNKATIVTNFTETANKELKRQGLSPLSDLFSNPEQKPSDPSGFHQFKDFIFNWGGAIATSGAVATAVANVSNSFGFNPTSFIPALANAGKEATRYGLSGLRTIAGAGISLVVPTGLSNFTSTAIDHIPQSLIDLGLTTWVTRSLAKDSKTIAVVGTAAGFIQAGQVIGQAVGILKPPATLPPAPFVEETGKLLAPVVGAAKNVTSAITSRLPNIVPTAVRNLATKSALTRLVSPLTTRLEILSNKQKMYYAAAAAAALVGSYVIYKNGGVKETARKIGTAILIDHSLLTVSTAVAVMATLNSPAALLGGTFFLSLKAGSAIRQIEEACRSGTEAPEEEAILVTAPQQPAIKPKTPSRARSSAPRPQQQSPQLQRAQTAVPYTGPIAAPAGYVAVPRQALDQILAALQQQGQPAATTPAAPPAVVPQPQDDPPSYIS